VKRAASLVLVTLVLAGSAAAANLPALRSPSGNIRCVYAAKTDPRNQGGLFCTIGRAAYTTSLQHRCTVNDGLDWHGFLLSTRGRGEVVCTGGALWFGTPRAVTVAYGRVWHAGPYACTSRLTGVTCRNGGGHGLFVSRATWRTW
jgi:hypothetical protein